MIAAGVSLSRSTVKRALHELEQAGMVEKTPLVGQQRPDLQSLSNQIITQKG